MGNALRHPCRDAKTFCRRSCDKIFFSAALNAAKFFLRWSGRKIFSLEWRGGRGARLMLPRRTAAHNKNASVALPATKKIVPWWLRCKKNLRLHYLQDWRGGSAHARSNGTPMVRRQCGRRRRQRRAILNLGVHVTKHCKPRHWGGQSPVIIHHPKRTPPRFHL